MGLGQRLIWTVSPVGTRMQALLQLACLDDSHRAIWMRWITPGIPLETAEENWIRAGGRPKAQLENKRHPMSDSRYKAAGGCIP